MKTLALYALAGSVLLVTTTTPSAMEMYQNDLQSRVIQSEATADKQVSARLMEDEMGMFVNVPASGLTPRNVHALWFIVFGGSAQCDEECGATNVLELARS